MPASAAVTASSEAEEAAVFAHPPVAPDATAAYGEHPDQVIDFYRPRAGTGIGGGGPVPLVVLLHGGAWRAPYDREHISPLAAHLAGHGFAVASVEYRRGADPSTPTPSGGPPLAGRYPETLDDVAAAVDAVPALALQALGPGVVDPRRVVLSGHSAGGHLALWAAARQELPEDLPWHLAVPTPLRGVVALAPLADFESAVRLGVCGGAVQQFLGGPETGPARLRHVDPRALLPSGTATAIVHGRADIAVPLEISERFADGAAVHGEVVQLTVLEGVGHFALIDPGADACAIVVEEIAQLAW
ncbi:alpha/beta hydrolase [Streptomyces sp. H27-D2]|nr:alpha/beta hydrolase [Streptomyces sp. H27-D2]MEC4016438.1 alpha/beta hydrolase [Streptomyces sp. H27-D2]